MVTYIIEVSEDARVDLSYYTAFERKTIVTEIRVQLTDRPDLETRNRKKLRDNPIAAWELRVGRYRVFYEVDGSVQIVLIVAVGHKVRNKLIIRDREVEL